MALLQRTASNAEDWSDVLSVVLARRSFSDIERMVNSVRRSAALNGNNLGEHLSSLLTIDNRPKQDRIDLAVQLVQAGLASQRRAHELTGVARDTIRERLKGAAAEKSE